MTLEIAIIVSEGEEDAFGRGRAVVAASGGCHAVWTTQGVASPSRFALSAEWRPGGA